MLQSFDRRRFLQGSAMLGGALLTCSAPLDRSARAAPVRIDAPVIDELTVREITDGTHDIFLRGVDLPDLAVRRTGFPEAAQGKTLESEWGLALHLESVKGNETRRYLLDFGFTSDVYANNLELMKIDVAEVDALIISHGHYDHVGGLMGFLEAQRPRMRKDLRLYTGGEDDFCYRFNRNPDGSFTRFGASGSKQVEGARRTAGAVGNAHHYRRPCLHHRHRSARQHRTRVAEHLGGIRR